jgi:hypothetical protein
MEERYTKQRHPEQNEFNNGNPRHNNSFRLGLGSALWAHNEVDRLPELAADLIHRRGAGIVTGIAGCCARTASGQAAAPPSPAMNSRRFVIRLSRRRGRAGWVER